MKGRYDIDFSQWFYYDETSPTFLRWKIDIYQGGRIGKYKGDVAGCLEWRKNGKDNYCSVGLKNKRYKAHNIILSLHGFELEKGFVADHIDGNTHNGNIKNLRVAPYRHNCMNCRLEPTSTGKIGVCIVNNGGYKSVRASWVTEDMKVRTKSFSISKYGYENALKLASEYRDEQIKHLNEAFANYTERHLNAN